MEGALLKQRFLLSFPVMLTIASIVSLAVGIWEDYSPRHPADEPRVGW